VADRISPFRTTGIGFDLRPVEAHFKAPLAGPGLSHRLSFQGGDFFADPLPRADVIVMGHVLHDWDLEERKLLIRKAYDTLPLGGALIVYDAIIEPGAPAERLRPLDEPQHADRDARWCRLHRGSVLGLDARGWIPADPLGAPARPGQHGGGIK
jgi:hypothetical protein